jgi:hypothetical protein
MKTNKYICKCGFPSISNETYTIFATIKVEDQTTPQEIYSILVDTAEKEIETNSGLTNINRDEIEFMFISLVG